MNKIIFGKSGRKSPVRRPRRRWEDNVKLKEIGHGEVSVGFGYGAEVVCKDLLNLQNHKRRRISILWE
jgi:hypothetical protein